MGNYGGMKPTKQMKKEAEQMHKRTMPDGPVAGEQVVVKRKKYRMTEGGKMR